MGGSKMNYRRLIALLLVFVLVFASVSEVFAATKEGTASKIKLEDYTGTVKIKNASGKSVKTKTDLRLYSGYTIETKAKSTAYVSLDSTKAIKIMSGSKVTFEKSGKKINVMLEKGTVVADVSEALTKDSSMDIYTTNAVTGIMGTDVEVSYNVAENADGSSSSSTTINMASSTTENQDRFSGVKVEVSEGQGTTIGSAQVTPVINDITIKDFNPESAKMIIVDGQVSEKTKESIINTFLSGLSQEQQTEVVNDIVDTVNTYQSEMQTQENAAESAQATTQAEATGGTGNVANAGVEVFPEAQVSEAPAEIKNVTPVTPVTPATPATPVTPAAGSGDDGGDDGGYVPPAVTTEYDIAYNHQRTISMEFGKYEGYSWGRKAANGSLNGTVPPATESWLQPYEFNSVTLTHAGWYTAAIDSSADMTVFTPLDTSGTISADTQAFAVWSGTDGYMYCLDYQLAPITGSSNLEASGKLERVAGHWEYVSGTPYTLTLYDQRNTTLASTTKYDVYTRVTADMLEAPTTAGFNWTDGTSVVFAGWYHISQSGDSIVTADAQGGETLSGNTELFAIYKNADSTKYYLFDACTQTTDPQTLCPVFEGEFKKSSGGQGWTIVSSGAEYAVRFWDYRLASLAGSSKVSVRGSLTSGDIPSTPTGQTTFTDEGTVYTFDGWYYLSWNENNIVALGSVSELIGQTVSEDMDVFAVYTAQSGPQKEYYLLTAKTDSYNDGLSFEKYHMEAVKSGEDIKGWTIYPVYTGYFYDQKFDTLINTTSVDANAQGVLESLPGGGENFYTWCAVMEEQTEHVIYLEAVNNGYVLGCDMDFIAVYSDGTDYYFLNEKITFEQNKAEIRNAKLERVVNEGSGALERWKVTPMPYSVGTFSGAPDIAYIQNADNPVMTSSHTVKIPAANSYYKVYATTNGAAWIELDGTTAFTFDNTYAYLLIEPANISGGIELSVSHCVVEGNNGVQTVPKGLWDRDNKCPGGVLSRIAPSDGSTDIVAMYNGYLLCNLDTSNDSAEYKASISDFIANVDRNGLFSDSNVYYHPQKVEGTDIAFNYLKSIVGDSANYLGRYYNVRFIDQRDTQSPWYYHTAPALNANVPQLPLDPSDYSFKIGQETRNAAFEKWYAISSESRSRLNSLGGGLTGVDQDTDVFSVYGDKDYTSVYFLFNEFVSHHDTYVTIDGGRYPAYNEAGNYWALSNQ